MSKTTDNPSKMRLDIYTEYSNGLQLKKFCNVNRISINSMVNFLIVQFLLNDNSFKFTNPTKPMNNQIKTVEANDEYEDDHNNIVDILKQLMEDKSDGKSTDSIEYTF